MPPESAFTYGLIISAPDLSLLTANKMVASGEMTVVSAPLSASKLSKCRRSRHTEFQHGVGGFGSWLAAAARRLHRNVLSAALANKLAQIAWTVLAQGRRYEAHVEPRVV